MKISILEDRPWVVKEFVKELREREAEIQNIFYFCEKDSEYERSSEHMEQLEEELNVPIIRVESYDFEEKLDQCYSDPDIRFLFDMDLTGDYSAHFLERINVLYALESSMVEIIASGFIPRARHLQRNSWKKLSPGTSFLLTVLMLRRNFCIWT